MRWPKTEKRARKHLKRKHRWPKSGHPITGWSSGNGLHSILHSPGWPTADHEHKGGMTNAIPRHH
jgi:hypothetical protein